MAKIATMEVLRTKSALFVRHDKAFGYLIYSPYSGLVFASRDAEGRKLLEWLNGDTSTAPSDEYERALGTGWVRSPKGPEYLIPHLLPKTSDAWPILPNPERPILINWLLTGNCPLACQYCDAEDLMHGRSKEPHGNEVEAIADVILSYNPLVIVLTGGDPLFSPHLDKALRVLHNRAGLIIDTSGYTLNSTHLELIKKYDIFVRVSLDAERPRVNRQLRPVSHKFVGMQMGRPSTGVAAVNALCRCLDEGVNVAVQTVATKMNHSDFESLGDKLFRLGVSSWRVLMVTPSKDRYDAYKKLIGKKQTQKRLYNYILKRLYHNYENEWKHRMAVQVVHSETPNAVVLVSPDGTFYTESNVEGKGKVVLDNKNPRRPRLDSLFSKVNIQAHAERYLNLKWPSSWIK